MRHLLLCLILIGSQKLNSAFATIDRTLVPDLSTSQSEISHLNALRKYIPDAFSLRGDARIYVTPESNVPEEKKFLIWFFSPAVQAIVEKESLPRSPLKQIDFQVLIPQQQNGLSASAKALADVAATFSKIRAKFASEVDEVEEMLRLHKKVGSISSRGLIVGLINCLEPTQRGAIFKLTDTNEKIAALKKELTDEMVARNFKGEGELTVKAKLKELEKVIDREDRMIEMALHLYFLSRAQQMSAIEKILRPESRSEFADFIMQKFIALLGDKETKRFRDLVIGNFKDVFGEIVESKVEMWTQKASYSIVEAPPTVAIHRGCINGDCFSKFAFGFAYAPAERTYIIRNDRGENLASIYAMAVTSNGIPSLYVHEIGSPHINAETAGWIARALHESLKELGFERLIFSTKQMHWQLIQTHLLNSCEPQFVTINHTDALTRQLIGNQMVAQMRTRLVNYGIGADYAKSHDIAEVHTRGRIYVPPSNTNYRIDTRTKDGPNFKYILDKFENIFSCANLF